MKRTFGLLATVLVAGGCGFVPSRTSEAATLAELAALPEGIDVSFAADRIRAVDDGPDAEDERYVWTFQPTVRATRGPLIVVNYGYCVMKEGHWILEGADHYANPRVAVEEFRRQFDCRKSQLLLGQAYSGEDEFSGQELTATRLKWFIIAEDADGNRFKGEAELDLLAEADPAK